MKKAIEKIVQRACEEVVACIHDHLKSFASGGGEKTPKPAKKAKADKPATGKKRGRPPMTPEQKAERQAARKAAKDAAASATAAA